MGGRPHRRGAHTKPIESGLRRWSTKICRSRNWPCGLRTCGAGAVDSRSMQPNRVFFPQALLDNWVADERIELSGIELMLRDEGRRFKIEEAVHIVRDVSGEDA